MNHKTNLLTAILAVMLLSAGSLLAQDTGNHQHQDAKANQHQMMKDGQKGMMHGQMQGMMAEKEMHRMMTSMMCKNLDFFLENELTPALDDGQIVRLKALQARYKSDSEQPLAALHNALDVLKKMQADDSSDLAETLAQVRTVRSLQADLDIIRFKALRKANTILTPEQRNALKSMPQMSMHDEGSGHQMMMDKEKKTDSAEHQKQH